MRVIYLVLGIMALALLGGAWYRCGTKPAELGKNNAMSFFITSVNPGNGANLGGLAGADRYCQTLASTAGAGNKTWRAYLSTVATGTEPAVNARDRIGSGPWYNYNGVLIAANISELHLNNKINKQTALTEKGSPVNGRGDQPNQHDILTGSSPAGMAITTSTDTTCGNWTLATPSSGAAMVGHHDRIGVSDTNDAISWNASHYSRGCSLQALAGTGGGGLLYCFSP